MVEGEKRPKRGVHNPEDTKAKGGVAAFVTQILEESGYGKQIPQEEIETVIGHFLFARAFVQADIASQLLKYYLTKEARALKANANRDATLALRFAPSVVEQAVGTIQEIPASEAFHRARQFGRRLASEEFNIRGWNGYLERMEKAEEAQLAQTMHDIYFPPAKRSTAA